MDKETEEKYRQAGALARAACVAGSKQIKEGATLLSVAELTESMIKDGGAELAFPTNISIDSQAAHFTPRHDDDLVFERGQVVKLDVGAHVDGHIGDTAITVEVGSSVHKDLIRASKEALNVAIDLVHPGIPISTIGDYIDQTIRSYGFVPVENLTGHGLERYNLHAGLNIPNIRNAGKGRLEEGVVIAIEPFASTGEGKVGGKVLGNIYLFNKKVRVKAPEAEDLQGAIMEQNHSLPFSERFCASVISDPAQPLHLLNRRRGIFGYPILSDVPGSFVSQAEHTVLVTEGGCEVLTKTK